MVSHKDLRKTKKITLDELSKKIFLSSSTISLFENSKNILQNEKIDLFSNFYGYSDGFFTKFDNDLSALFSDFMHHIVYIDDERAKESFNKILAFLEPFKNTSLYSAASLAKLVYYMYDDDLNQVNVKDTLEAIPFLSDKYKMLAYSYLGQCHTQAKDFDTSKSYFDQATFYLSKDNTFEDMYHYFYSSYYIYFDNVLNSISHCEKAIALFNKSQNFKRLINTNILIANQYLKLRDYKKSLEMNQAVLVTARKENDLFPQRVALNNIGFIYMMQSKFKEAAHCFEEIPKSQVKERHLYSYVICLGETEDFDKGNEVCQIGQEIATNPYYQYIFKIYGAYFKSKDLKKLSRNLEKVFEKYEEFIDNYEKELLCIVLGNQFKRNKNLKKALDYYEKLHELSYQI